jgi:integrase/recombinase XerD
MASVKVIYYTHKQYTDGSHPIMLQIIDGKSVVRKTLHRCSKDQWDEKTKRVNKKMNNYSMINAMISDKLAEAEKALLVGDNPFLAISSLTLREVVDMEVTRLTTAIKNGALASIQTVISDLEEFYPKNLNINIKKIDKTWLNGFVGRLLEKGNGDNTINKKLDVLKRAIKSNGGTLNKSADEFRHAGNSTTKQKLTRDEFKSIVDLQFEENNNLGVIRDFFILQVYLRGIRVGDLLQAKSENFQNSRFRYMSDKTNRHYDIKLLPEAEEIVNKYLGANERLFPFFTWKADRKATKFQNEERRLKHKESCTSTINNGLKKIAQLAGLKKQISSHWAKHTYAKFADSAIKNPMLTMPLLGHSSLAIHQRYLEDIRRDDELDDAADLVF